MLLPAGVAIVLSMLACLQLPWALSVTLVWLLGTSCIAAYRIFTRLPLRAFIIRTVLLGVLAAWCVWSNQQRVILPESVDAAGRYHEYSFSGQVVEFPRVTDGRVQFLFRPDERHGALPRLMRLSWYSYGGRNLPQIRAGEHWAFTARLRRPDSLANPGGFDAAKAAYVSGIGAVGYVRDGVRKGLPVTYGWLRVRSLVVERVNDVLQNHRAVPLVLALGVGARHRLTQDHWDVFRRTGTSHLLAISGLHITLAAGCGLLLGRLLLLVGAPVWLQYAFSAGFGFVYAALSGFALPAMRALSMLLLVLLLMLRRREYSAFDVLGVTVFIVLFADPWAAFKPGFWLSFIAVAVLIYQYRVFAPAAVVFDNFVSGWQLTYLRAKRAVIMMVVAQVLLVAGLAIPTLMVFGALPLQAGLVNLAAIPVFSFVIVPALLLVLISLMLFPDAAITHWSAQALADLLGAAMHALQMAADSDGLLWQLPSEYWVAWLLACAGVALALTPAALPLRLLSVLLVLPLVTGIEQLRTSDPDRVALNVHVLDVGHGLAVLVDTREGVLLYDAGPQWRSADAGQAVVIPAIRALGLPAPRRIVVSHSDSDHAGGLHSVLQYLGTQGAGEVKPYECIAGDSWAWGEVSFRVLHPAAGSSWSDNSGSCVLLIETHGVRVLLPGDIEADAERHLLSQGLLTSVDLVLMPHHGSKTSSTGAFVDAVHAQFAVASAGWGNRWGFPLRPVVHRWRESGACVLSTGDTGALTFSVRGGVLELTNMLRSAPKWNRSEITLPVWPWQRTARLDDCPRYSGDNAIDNRG